MQHYTKHQNNALLAIRIILAAIFFYAAYSKFFVWQGTPEGMSAMMANLMKLLTVVEPLAALAILFGFYTRKAAIVLAVILLGAIGTMQFMFGVGFATETGTGWNFPLVTLAGVLVLAAFGAGAYSLDSKKEGTSSQPEAHIN